MELINVKSLQFHNYAQKDRPKGCRYKMEKAHLIYMAAMGHVKEIKTPGRPSGKTGRQYKRRDMVPENETNN